jgi:transposase
LVPTEPALADSNAQEVEMEVIVDRCAGLDVHKNTVVVCVRSPGTGRQKRASEVRTFGTFEHELRAMRSWLIECRVTEVAMEATGVFWKPVWHVLADGEPFELLLVNPGHIKNVPGRKTDVNDATWIAQLLECGLLRSSFVPPVEIRELREITRYRRQLTGERGREIQRLQKLLEDANVKLSSVVTDTLGVTGRMILDALCDGERDPEVLAGMAQRRLKAKIDLLRQCVPGRFNDFHATMTRNLLDHIDYLDTAIARLDSQIDEMMIPFVVARDLLDTVPGIGRQHAENIIAEIGVDMSRFPTPAHLASWAGVCPGNNESAGKHKNTTTRHGNPWLTTILVEAAWSAIRTKDCYLGVRYRRIRKRRGEQRALMAIAHTILVICWHILNDNVEYHELGPDYLAGRDQPDRQRRLLVGRLEALGYNVQLTPAA